MSLDNSAVIKALMPLKLGTVSNEDIALEGQELDAEETRQNGILLEMFPDTSTQMLSWWERVYGLAPVANATIQQRQSAVVQAVAAKGGLSRAYFIALAQALGFTITITEIQPFMAGISRAGDILYDENAMFIWLVVVTAIQQYYFRSGQSSAGEPLGAPNENTIITSLFNKLKPAHTYVMFQYT